MVVTYRAIKDRIAGQPKDVYVPSTACAPTMGHTIKRDKDRNFIQKQTCINAYYHSMGGVDMMDQQLYGCPEKVLHIVQEIFPKIGHAVCFISPRAVQVSW